MAEPLLDFGPDIWLANGPTVGVLGFAYPTRMAVIRLTNGGLLIWSPVALTPALRAAVLARGPVNHILSPNHLHHLSLPDWTQAFPDARVHAPPGLRAKRQDIDFDDDLGDIAHPDWHGQVDQAVLQGNRITREVVFYHRASGTVLFCDILQQFDDDWFSGWRRIVARLDLMEGPEPRVPRKFRLAFRDKPQARKSLATILAWPAQSVVVAHGRPVTQDAQGFLRRAFDWIL